MMCTDRFCTCFSLFLLVAVAVYTTSAVNLRPIIGVLSLEPSKALLKTFPTTQSYFPASYVKFIEMGGGQVAPILIDRNVTYYEEVFKYTNGLLIPGGGIELKNISASGYGRAASILYKMAVEANNKGDRYPIWGTCLGAEALTILLDANNTYRLSPCHASNISLPLKMADDMQMSRLLNEKVLPSDVYTYLTTRNVTANFHNKCLLPETVKNSNLSQVLHILSTSKDSNGTEFVSTFEAIKYPFYGVQWHPEKNVFEWSRNETIPHAFEAVRVAQHFANFFVQEARQNNHAFTDLKQEEHALIYNTKPIYPTNAKTEFTQVYLFTNDSKVFFDWSKRH